MKHTIKSPLSVSEVIQRLDLRDITIIACSQNNPFLIPVAQHRLGAILSKNSPADSLFRSFDSEKDAVKLALKRIAEAMMNNRSKRLVNTIPSIVGIFLSGIHRERVINTISHYYHPHLIVYWSERDVILRCCSVIATYTTGVLFEPEYFIDAYDSI